MLYTSFAILQEINFEKISILKNTSPCFWGVFCKNKSVKLQPFHRHPHFNSFFKKVATGIQFFYSASISFKTMLSAMLMSLNGFCFCFKIC